MYRYFGRLFGRCKARLILTSVTFHDQGAHAAVWLGINTRDNSHWVQAGIEQEGYDEHPWIYIEIGEHGRQKSLQRWPTSLDAELVVRLQRCGRGFWRVHAAGHTSRRVPVPGGQIQALLEMLGPARATARINRKVVRS